MAPPPSQSSGQAGGFWVLFETKKYAGKNPIFLATINELKLELQAVPYRL